MGIVASAAADILKACLAGGMLAQLGDRKRSLHRKSLTTAQFLTPSTSAVRQNQPRTLQKKLELKCGGGVGAASPLAVEPSTLVMKETPPTSSSSGKVPSYRILPA